MTIESFCTHVARGMTRGIIQAVVEGIEETTNRPEGPVFISRPKTAQESAAVGMPRAPDVAASDEQAEHIDLFAAMKEAVREGEADLSDVAMVERALREQAFAREVETLKSNGTKRVNAPDA